ncbi:hypothetical protein [Spirillospora sp. CA-128828]|uniref:hypothetical protein n=1 Tax=Spirillospora sp. CA-128828 TaxID=3240033 RepID=UPI003D9172F8
MPDGLHFAQFHRLEPMTRPPGTGGQLDEAVEARVADPLFLLARQWQLAEFQGEDGGSPVAAQLKVTSAPFTRFRPENAQAALPLPDGVPLEFLVEGDDREFTMRDAARAGLRFLGAIDRELRAAVLEKCPLRKPDPVDTAGQSMYRVLSRRAPDGGELEERLADGWRPAGMAAAQRQRFDAAARAWRTWFAAEHAPATPPSSWVAERLEHRFGVGASLDGTERVLAAPEYGGGKVEPYQLDLGGGTLGTPATTAGTTTLETLPTRATYPGMPSDRWWEFEDGHVNLPAVGAGPPDLARLLVVEFANVYGDDHWVIPVDLPVGSLHQVTGLTVTDTFGDTLAVPPVEDPAWSMFRHTDSVTGRPGPPLLALLSAGFSQLEGAAVEEVLMARDEMANLAWAVERTVRGADGRPRRRSGERHDDEPPPASADRLAYRLVTGVPPHWIPLVPVPLTAGSPAIRFRRGQIPHYRADGTRKPQVKAVGRLLEPSRKRFYIREEELPRSGLTVTRVPVATRGRDGRLYRWTARRVSTGLGEAASGLAFDEALPGAVP